MGEISNVNLDIIQQMVNAMIGGAMLILPILFVQGGLILSFGVLALSGFICYQTCQLYMNHLKPGEKDISQIIHRVLGKNWYVMFNILSCLYLFLVCMLYYLLLCDILYQICEFGLLKAGNENFAPKNVITLDQFGMFYVAVLILIPASILVFIKNLDLINKITQFGVYAIYAYLFFILYVFFTNVDRGNLGEGIGKVPLFSMDIGHLAGTCSLAFTLHTAFISILQQDPKFKRNGGNNLKYSYFGGFLVYLFIGLFGGLGIIGRKAYVMPPQSITEFFEPTEIPPLIVEVMYFCNLFTVLPCFFGIFRTRLLKFIYQDEEIPQKAITFVNMFYLIFSFIVRCIPTIRAGDIMSANGSISCFFIVYLIPIFLHLKCYHGESNVIQNRKKTNNASYLRPDHSIIDNDLIINNQSSVDDKEDLISYQECCNDHKEIDKYPKSVRYGVLGTVFMIGFMILVYGLFNLFIRDKNLAKTGQIPDVIVEAVAFDGETGLLEMQYDFDLINNDNLNFTSEIYY